MSSFSDLPSYKTLKYWHKKLAGKPYRNRFLLTKLIEIGSFKRVKANNNNKSKKTTNVSLPTPKKHQLQSNPKLSLIIPVYVNSIYDLKKLELLFQSIENLVVNPDYVIIVDDHSTLKYSYPKEYIFYRNKTNKGPASSRNIGIEIAKKKATDIFAFTDSDCILSDNWVLNIKKVFNSDNKYNILSGQTLSKGDNWLSKYHQLNGTLNGRKFKNLNRLLYGTTANLAVTNQVVNEIKFNENFPNAAGEDIEFCFNANLKGFAIKHVPDMKIYHNYGYGKNIFKNLKIFIKQFRKYSKGEKVLLELIPNYYSYFNSSTEISGYE